MGFDANGPKEFRIFGPPGTGKTTEISKRVRGTVSRFGGNSVMVMSFTRTAAIEVAGRDLPIAGNRVGTLHSFAFRAVGSPKIAETKVSEWNDRVEEALKVSNCTRRPAHFEYDEDPFARARAIYSANESGGGDAALSAYSLARSRLESPPKDLRRFVDLWESWKEESGYLDFTDLILKAIEEADEPPVPARILYADEVQDFSPLELKLIRKWGADMRFIVLAGDDDQCIYSFRGARPEAFLDPPIPDDQRIVLPESYRLPEEIKSRSDRWAHRLSRREEKSWTSRGPGGAVKISPLDLDSPHSVIDAVKLELAKGDEWTVMVLASCGYMLDRLCREMRVSGLPFYNPYRPSHGAWNPGVAARRRLSAYLCNDYRATDSPRSHTWLSVATWVDHLDRKKSGLRHGAKKEIKENAKDYPDEYLTHNDFEQIGIGSPPRGDFEWFAKRVLPSKRSSYAYTLQTLRTRGLKVLKEHPRVVVGTIHSVKGGQADSVFLFPDLSQAGVNEWGGDEERRDSVIRLFYVGMTRARHKLFLCSPAMSGRGKGSNFVPWE